MNTSCYDEEHSKYEVMKCLPRSLTQAQMGFWWTSYSVHFEY